MKVFMEHTWADGYVLIMRPQLKFVADENGEPKLDYSFPDGEEEEQLAQWLLRGMPASTRVYAVPDEEGE